MAIAARRQSSLLTLSHFIKQRGLRVLLPGKWALFTPMREASASRDAPAAVLARRFL